MVNRLDEAVGASVVSSSRFFPPPHDAGYLLRQEVSGGYAAAVKSSPLPHWIEFDLGSTQSVDRIDLEWLDRNNYAIDFEVSGSVDGESWTPLVQIQSNEQWAASYNFSVAAVRRVKVTCTRFAGQQRMLIRRCRLGIRSTESPVDFAHRSVVLPWLSAPTSTCTEVVLFQNAWYQLAVDPSKRISVNAADGGRSSIVHGLRTATEWRQRDGQQRAEAAFYYAGLKRNLPEGAAELLVSSSGPIMHTQLVLHCRTDSPQIEVASRSVAIHLRGAIEIDRHAIVVEFAIEPKRLYQKNRRIAHRIDQPVYWLDRQGAQFGEGLQSATIYHAPGISSLELEVALRRLIINLDLAADHPHIVDDPEGSFLDASRSRLLPMSVLLNHFNLTFGYSDLHVPRFMAQKGGFVAAHVWTEHGCFTALPVHKAVFLGDDSLGTEDAAIGGFVAHQIPTTKSVFFANNAAAEIDAQSKTFHGPMVAIRNSEEFSTFLDFLHTKGHDICLHCPQPESSEPSEIEEALAYMRDRYGSSVWIDHFWYQSDGKKAGCVESFCSRGLLGPTSQLWARYGTRFFWNCVYEYLAPDGLRSFKNSLNHWLKEQSCPNPIYWRHPTLGVSAGELNARKVPYVSWPTWMWNPRPDFPHYEPDQLESLVENWGVWISHAYPTYVGETNNDWCKVGDATRISEGFERLLRNLAQLQSDGLLLNTTIPDLLTYWMALEDVSLEIDAARERVLIGNNGETLIRDLAMATETDQVRVNGERPSGRWNSENYLFWFDLPPGSTAVLTGLLRRC